MLKGGNPLTVGVGIVIEVIRKNNSDYDPETVGGPDSLPTTYDPIYLGTLLRLFAKHIPDFMALIQSSKHTVNDDGKVRSVERGELNSAWGAKIEPLGFDRFKTCELMAELLHCSNMGLLNEPGSDDYVRNRDAERERLFREGAYNPQREGTSTVDYNDSTADFTNGSVLGSGSPDDKVLEVTNTGEEEGFEDVSASGVLVGREKDLDDKEGGSREPHEDRESQNEPKRETSENSVQAEAPKSSSDPQSPTASGLTNQVGDIKLDSDRSSVNPSGSGEPAKAAAGETASSSQSGQEQPSKTSAPMASHPEDVPAPLFAAKPTEASSSTAGQTDSPPHETDPAAGTAPGQSNEGQTELADPYVQYDTDGKPVVGDYLKIMFVQNRVVPTILVRTSWKAVFYFANGDLVRDSSFAFLGTTSSTTLCTTSFSKSLTGRWSADTTDHWPWTFSKQGG